jgi:hypothetical protein
VPYEFVVEFRRYAVERAGSFESRLNHLATLWVLGGTHRVAERLQVPQHVFAERLRCLMRASLELFEGFRVCLQERCVRLLSTLDSGLSSSGKS